MVDIPQTDPGTLLGEQVGNKMQNLTNLTNKMHTSLQDQGLLPGKSKTTEMTDPFQGLRNMAKNPKYQAMSPEMKARLTGRYFDKYLEPYYRNKGVTDLSAAKQRVLRGLTGKLVTPEQSAEPDHDFLTHLGLQVGEQAIKAQRGIGVAADRAGDLLTRAMLYTSPGDYQKQREVVNKIRDWGGRTLSSYNDVLDQMEQQVKGSMSSSDVKRHENDKASTPLSLYIPELPIRMGGSVNEFLLGHPEYMAAEGLVKIGAEGLLGKGVISELLATGSTKQKLAYNAIRGSAIGLLGGAYQGEKPRDIAKDTVLFGSLDGGFGLAGEGAKLLTKAAPGANKSIQFMSKYLTWAGPQRVASTLSNLDKAEEALKLDTRAPAPNEKIGTIIFKATAKVRNSVAQGLGYDNYKAAKAAGKQAQVASGILDLLKQSNKEAAVHNPEIVQGKVSNSIKEEMKNPSFAEIANKLQIMGIDIVKANTESTRAKAAATAGDLNAVKSKVAKDAHAAVNKIMEGIGTGAASSKEQSQMYSDVVKIVETNVPHESKAHTLTFMWGIRDKLPDQVRPLLKNAMEVIYGPKSTIKTWNQAAARLERHEQKLIASGHVTPNDMRGVFRSTKLVGPSTEWQRQLDDELKGFKEARRMSTLGAVDKPVKERGVNPKARSEADIREEAAKQARMQQETSVIPTTASKAGAEASSKFFDDVKKEHPDWSFSKMAQEAAKREKEARGQ